MRNVFLPLSLGVVITLSSAVALAENATTTNTAPTTATAVSPDVQKKVGEILKDVVTINNNEVTLAKLVLQKSQNADVKKFAREMEADHTHNMQAAMQLSKKLNMPLVDSDKSAALEVEGKDALDKLQTLQGKDFDVAYMDAMVAGHQKVLDAIDKDFLPVATNPHVIMFLKNTRAKVEHHLSMAKEVRKKLG